jgi:drug/metabolite transporter (DMT)-like permease
MRMTPRREGPPVAALYALICLIWGSTWLVIKIGLEGVPPFLAAGLRFALASCVLFALIAARGTKIRLNRDGAIAVLSCGGLGFTLSYACVYWAEQYLSSGLVAILYCTMPLFTALLSRFWTRSETLPARKVGGLLVAMAGTVVLFLRAHGLGAQNGPRAAVALVSVLAAAVNLVAVKKYGRERNVFVLNAGGMAIGAAGLLALSAAFESHAALSWSRANVCAIVYLALVGSVAAFQSYYSLVKVMDATRLSLISLIFPIVAVLLGRAYLHEPIPARRWAGMALVLGGVALSILPAARLRTGVGSRPVA